MDLFLVLAVVVLVAFTIVKVWNGTWCSTWVGSGQAPSGRKFPGGPTADPLTGSKRESPPAPATW
jgi:hypothetical protein